jgi:hypothetical protein
MSSSNAVFAVVAGVAVIVTLVAYIYVNQPSTVGVAPEQTRTEQAK